MNGAIYSCRAQLLVNQSLCEKALQVFAISPNAASDSWRLRPAPADWVIRSLPKEAQHDSTLRLR